MYILKIPDYNGIIMSESLQKPTGIKLTENGAQPTYPTDRSRLEAAVMRSTTGRDVEFVEPTTPDEIADFLQGVHRESSNGGKFPIDFRQAVRDLKRKRRK